jgi:hypothetical protein
LLRSNPKSADLAEPAFRTEECAHLARLYRELQTKTRELVPPRKALNLRAIPSAAPYLAIFEIKDESRILVRLVGTGFVLRTGIDNTGKDALEVVPPDLRDWTLKHFLKMARAPCASLCVAHESYGGSHMLTEVLSLPFADASGKANLIVSASIPFERPEFRLLDEEMAIGGFFEVVYLDIGAGTGVRETAG